MTLFRNPMRSRRTIAMLTLLVALALCLGSWAFQGQEPMVAVNGNVICPATGGDCYPRIFEPTHEFKTVLPGQEIPAGLHVRFNMATGGREAKLLDPADDKEDVKSVHIQAGGQTTLTVDSEEPQEQSLAVVAQPQDEASGVSFPELAERLTVTDTEAELLSILDKMENEIHDIKWGRWMLEDKPTVARIQTLLRDPNASIRAKTALVLGGAMSNNPDAQDAAMKASILPLIISHFPAESDVTVLNRMLFALGALVRSHDHAKDEFISNSGLQLLMELHDRIPNLSLQRKCIHILSDILDPNMRVLPETIKPSPHELAPWCRRFEMAILQGSELLQESMEGLIQLLRIEPCGRSPPMAAWIHDQIQREKDTDRLPILHKLHEALHGDHAE